MNKRVAHIIKNSYQMDQQTHNGVTSKSFADFYWCGKAHNYIIDDAPLSPLEQARTNLFEEEQKADPWPECSKCRKAKEKSQQRSKPTQDEIEIQMSDGTGGE